MEVLHGLARVDVLNVKLLIVVEFIELQVKIPLIFKLFIHVTSLLNVVYPLTFKLLIHVIGCDIFWITTYDRDVDVVIFDGVGANAKSPYVGVKTSLVLIDNTPVSKNNVVLNFNSSCLKNSCDVKAGAIGSLNN